MHHQAHQQRKPQQRKPQHQPQQQQPQDLTCPLALQVSLWGDQQRRTKTQCSTVQTRRLQVLPLLLLLPLLALMPGRLAALLVLMSSVSQNQGMALQGWDGMLLETQMRAMAWNELQA